MSCPDCTAAQTNPDWGGYHARCQGCKVRALACGMEFFQSSAGGGITPAYRAALRTLFGDNAKQGHEQVKAEHTRVHAMGKSARSTTRGN